MRPMTHCSKSTISNLQKAAFTEIRHREIAFKFNPTGCDEYTREVALWHRSVFLESLLPLCLAPFSRVLGWPMTKIENFVADIKSDIVRTEVKFYHIMHVYQVQKQRPVIL